MEKHVGTAYIGPKQIMEDWDVSRATAYNIIKKLNAQLKKEHPTALIIAGKVNRIWYEKACLQQNMGRSGNGYGTQTGVI